jgi:predicted SPOUT superfamily RNA methylase MTH1
MSAAVSDHHSTVKRSWKLSVAVPSSLVADVPHLREKTSRLGFLGRAFAIFRVNEVIVYSDSSGPEASGQARFISSVLGYMETPQHLRKHLIRMNPDLRYVGILPPLRTPNHPISGKISDLRIGDIREGVVVDSESRNSKIDIGIGSLAELPAKLRAGSRISVRIQTMAPKIQVESIDTSRIDIYWGFRVTLKNLPLGRLIKEIKPDVVVATSRLGKSVSTVLDQTRTAVKAASSVLVAFGSPKRGLHAIVESEGMDLNDLTTFTINFIPNQGTQTVRTEEAVYSALTLLNTIGE